jgi:fatty acid desaturase
MFSEILNPKEYKALTVLAPWKSMLAIIAEWTLIIAAIALHRHFPVWYVYFPVWLIISTRLYAMYSLLHDAIHFSISRSKWLNDVVGQLFLGVPLFISLKEMRKVHLAHHKYLQTAKDPEMKHLQYDEFQFPKTRFQLFKLGLFDLTGLNFLYYKLQYIVQLLLHLNRKNSTGLFRLLMMAAAVFAAYQAGILSGLLLYWIIPYATLYQLLNRIRLSTEHFNLHPQNHYKTRSVISSLPEKLFLSPYNLGYHLEHHLFPGVPFYNLPELHEQLSRQPQYSSDVVMQKSYLYVLKDLIKR